MAKSEILINTQTFLINKHESIFKVIVNLGGLILQSQFAEWLYNTQDSVTCTRFIKTLKENQLIKTQRLGSANILIITTPVLIHLGVNQKSVKVTASKLKRSALIMEKYLLEDYSHKTPDDLVKRMSHSNVCAMQSIGLLESRILESYISYLTNRNWDTSSLEYEYDLMIKRLEYNKSFQLNPNRSPLILDKEEDRQDLYNLACQNTYISKASLSKNPKGKDTVNVYMDIFNVYNLKPEKMAKLIHDTDFTIEVMFADYKHDNHAVVHINVYTYGSSEKYREDVYSYLLATDLFGFDLEELQSKVVFHFFNNSIGNISVEKIQ